ncbi:MAG: tRNA (guanosine(37)-N1)-methyltransferase TrmD, partial [Phycisphaerae bacterium]
RPRVFRGMAVPEVLLSGDHGAIARWRAEESVRRTRERRGDLLADG